MSTIINDKDVQKLKDIESDNCLSLSNPMNENIQDIQNFNDIESSLNTVNNGNQIISFRCSSNKLLYVLLISLGTLIAVLCISSQTTMIPTNQSNHKSIARHVLGDTTEISSGENPTTENSVESNVDNVDSQATAAKYPSTYSPDPKASNIIADRSAGCATLAMNAGYSDGLSGTARDETNCCCCMLAGDYNDGYNQGQEYRIGFNQGVDEATEGLGINDELSEEQCSKCPDFCKSKGFYFCGIRLCGHPGFEAGRARGQKTVGF